MGNGGEGNSTKERPLDPKLLKEARAHWILLRSRHFFYVAVYVLPLLQGPSAFSLSLSLSLFVLSTSSNVWMHSEHCGSIHNCGYSWHKLKLCLALIHHSCVKNRKTIQYTQASSSSSFSSSRSTWDFLVIFSSFWGKMLVGSESTFTGFFETLLRVGQQCWPMGGGGPRC